MLKWHSLPAEMFWRHSAGLGCCWLLPPPALPLTQGIDYLEDKSKLHNLEQIRHRNIPTRGLTKGGASLHRRSAYFYN